MSERQNQLQEMLINRYCFKAAGSKQTGIGLQLTLTHETGLTARIGAYRICFHQTDEPAADASGRTSYPAKQNPRCFDTSEKKDIGRFLDGLLGIVRRKRMQRAGGR
jgi:hypothetical protein